MQLLDDEEELAYQGGKKLARLASVPDSRPAWMRQLLKSANDWLKLIPQVCQTSLDKKAVNRWFTFASAYNY